jgi:hypothetical protein
MLPYLGPVHTSIAATPSLVAGRARCQGKMYLTTYSSAENPELDLVDRAHRLEILPDPARYVTRAVGYRVSIWEGYHVR